MNTPGNAGKPITIYDAAELANTAYLKAFTPSNITKGFQVSGLYPLNSDIFGEQDFLPSNVIDRTDPNLSKASSQIKPLSSNETSVITAAPLTSNYVPLIKLPPRSSDNSMTKAENTPSTSTGGLTSQNRVSIISNIILPHEIRPIPKAPPRKGTASRGRKNGKARILTDTPEINEIQKDTEKAMQRKRKLELKKNKKSCKKES
ncbi:hypothetical protein NQ314_021056 [Rhamnusium bicolor]|uniref:Uncharacterized protein n=1 Tax=Rhamnusium bicolor TaxID=1586634 RepID=A0AAV8WJS0_9CUCU|nr:hypothetical protein NQ314_021056 [Rhamnusium bicolor]